MMFKILNIFLFCLNLCKIFVTDFLIAKLVLFKRNFLRFLNLSWDVEKRPKETRKIVITLLKKK